MSKKHKISFPDHKYLEDLINTKYADCEIIDIDIVVTDDLVIKIE